MRSTDYYRDEKYIGTVKVNGTEVILDENGQFILSPASGEQTIVVTDKAGNETRVTVTVNDGHTYEWQSENGQYWQKCKFCNHETAKRIFRPLTSVVQIRFAERRITNSALLCRKERRMQPMGVSLSDLAMVLLRRPLRMVCTAVS